MRDPARIDRIIGRLRFLWKLHPDQRLGQLVANLAPRDQTFHVEDDQMEATIASVIEHGWCGEPAAGDGT